jgi:uncharacterized membrane protein YphA (DoxX/SURF4 family)
VTQRSILEPFMTGIDSNKYPKIIYLGLKLAEFKLKVLDFLNPLVILGIRLWMAKIFWASGILKLPNGFLGIGKGDWESTLYLFTNEHPIPFFSPAVAAYTGTFFEIVCPVLLVFGLGTRLAAVILLIMTAFIQFSYQANVEQEYWMILFAVLIFQGGGKISADYWVRKKVIGN